MVLEYFNCQRFEQFAGEKWSCSRVREKQESTNVCSSLEEFGRAVILASRARGWQTIATGGPLSTGGWVALSRGARARARGIYLAETVAITSFPWELFGNRWGKFPRTGWPAQPRSSSQPSPAAHTLHRQCNNSIFLPTHLPLSLSLSLSSFPSTLASRYFCASRFRSFDVLSLNHQRWSKWSICCTCLWKFCIFATVYIFINGRFLTKLAFFFNRIINFFLQFFNFIATNITLFSTISVIN